MFCGYSHFPTERFHMVWDKNPRYVLCFHSVQWTSVAQKCKQCEMKSEVDVVATSIFNKEECEQKTKGNS